MDKKTVSEMDTKAFKKWLKTVKADECIEFVVGNDPIVCIDDISITELKKEKDE